MRKVGVNEVSLKMYNSIFEALEAGAHNLLKVERRVRGGDSNGPRDESNGLDLTQVYCGQV